MTDWMMTQEGMYWDWLDKETGDKELAGLWGTGNSWGRRLTLQGDTGIRSLKE